ncbi:MAG: glycosyltransferase [Geminicoccaceae bacterium]|nr:glycosyltransferase [Geminicoccaceae bacterium]MDW8444040.1 glycosyltransferase [Acetobacteraceae bacterium]MCS7268177.1 glycosyltransferase [Geminicoccaceae bacterium]MCX7630708.1 glycosyltransferase [Geminicoccaceae bacterium]MDW8125953.1 glycosyltransferase [Geminicoccaceae bacterium]
MTAEPAPRRLAAATGTVSVVVPLSRDLEDLEARHARLRAGLELLARPLEFVYVLDGPLARSRAALAALRRAGEPIEILAFARPTGEAAALTVGLRHARGAVVLTLDPEFPIDPAELPRLVHRLEAGEADLVTAARRVPGRAGGGKLERLLGWLLGCRFEDVRSPVRALRARVAAELTLYGNQHRFLPLLAQAQGFAVEELPVPALGRNGPGLVRAVGWPSLLLDVVTVFFLLRFLEKPFRFFGGFGLLVLVLGGLATAWLVFERLVLGVPLGDRPALILATLMVVLGIQIIAVGLIGELVTFAWARESADHRVERIVE